MATVDVDHDLACFKTFSAGFGALDQDQMAGVISWDKGFFYNDWELVMMQIWIL